ncbi:response regulator [Gracilimonas halophila]|uniref:Response regulator n=1 Tax=Gracilimonas halophila TaxID=1834464 RepID=A0ABW5JLC9_9BACT
MSESTSGYLNDFHQILVVDDDDLVLQSITDVLGDAGYLVHTAKNGTEALNKINDPKTHYDLVISDIAMPNLSGFDLLKKANSSPNRYYIPFILLSANNNKEFVKKGFKNGAVEFLDKPFNNAELLKSIDDVLINEQATNNRNVARIKKLNGLQDTIQKLNHLNSHKLRHSNSKVLHIIEMVKHDQLDIEKAFDLIGEMGIEIDQYSKKIQKIMDDRLEKLKQKLSLIKIDRKSILWFIDDDELTNILHSRIMELLLNIHIHTFLDPKEAVEQLEQSNRPPDVIFLDLNMPGISGFDFLDIMKEKNFNIPVVILSSSIQKSDIDRSLLYDNVVTYLNKPLNKKTLTLLTNE